MGRRYQQFSRRPLLALALAALALAPSACGGADAPARTRGEPSAGRWRTWVLTSAAQIAVPRPPARGSAPDKADLGALRRLVRARTPAMASAARAGNGQGAIEQWMDVNFELVAARAKDPPAASRAYGLLSVSIYDAVVAAWHAKYAFHRAPPQDVHALFAPGPDPSYPSEHAAIAGAASRVLAYLYPERPAAALDAMAERVARLRVV